MFFWKPTRARKTKGFHKANERLEIEAAMQRLNRHEEVLAQHGPCTSYFSLPIAERPGGLGGGRRRACVAKTVYKTKGLAALAAEKVGGELKGWEAVKCETCPGWHVEALRP